jgi:hypothetical protein
MDVVLVTSCTNRKKQSASPALQARNLSPGTLSSVISEWTSRVREATDRIKARDLYGGRSFREALAAQSELFVCSAGLGVMGTDALIPPYNLTVTGTGADNVLQRIQERRPVQPSEWWNSLLSGLRIDPLSAVIARKTDRLIVLALSTTYLQMVSEDLDSLSDHALRHLRVIGRPGTRENLSPRVAASVVVYDDRLEGAGAGRAGTRSDFRQRAARHFILTVIPKSRNADAREHDALVSQSLVGYSPRVVEQRKRHLDSELKDIIRDVWKEAGGRVTTGLRILRRERHIACEQGRFKQLFAQISDEIQNAKD